MISERRRVQRAFLESAESRIFIAGCGMLILWILVISVLLNTGKSIGGEMLTMTTTHLIGGRAASVSTGLALEGIHKAFVAFFAVYLDVMIMFLVYPVLIFSYRHFAERRFFRDHMQPFFDSAERSMTRLHGLKIVGIFFFVWFPLWMTGIIAGAVIGYLLGLRTWVTMTTVITGTACAVITWTLVFGEIYESLRGVHRAVPAVVTLIIIVGVVLARILRNRSGTNEMPGEDEGIPVDTEDADRS